MPKILDEYMNDPSINYIPEAIREIREIRDRIYERTKDMTPEEKSEYYRVRTEQFFASTGKPVPYAKVGPDGRVL